ncbi:MAG TPA: thioredoxin domain-containing protein [Bryobacteraceae bacterium]|nr:thioredoxin domain-containing protein [Bryobacteraceae bacterium]
MRKLLLLGMLAGVMTNITAAQRHVEGNPAGKVRVVAYEDLACSDCADFRKMLDEKLLPKYGGAVGFEHRDFPLAKHVWARKAAIAARFIEDTAGGEKGMRFRRDILASIKQVNTTGPDPWIAEWGTKNGVDPAKLVSAQEDKKYAGLVEKDFQDGVARGVSKTPTVFVEGVPFVETFTFEQVSKAIDEALAR